MYWPFVLVSVHRVLVQLFFFLLTGVSAVSDVVENWLLHFVVCLHYDSEFSHNLLNLRVSLKS